MSVLMVGTDFTPRSDRALRRATLVSRQSGYELLIVAVVDEDDGSETTAVTREQATVLLQEIQRTVTEQDGIACRTQLRIGCPFEQLAEAAQELGADLIVIGPHRRAPIRDAFSSITAEKILQQIPIPLISVNGVPSGPYKRLLLPIDLEAASVEKVTDCLALELAADAEIVLLHVYDAEARQMLGRAMVGEDKLNDYLLACASEAKEELGNFAAVAGLQRTKLRVAESGGRVAADIQSVAAREGADLVVLMQSSKGAFAKAVLGSVTEELLRHGKFDVLVVPAS